MGSMAQRRRGGLQEDVMRQDRPSLDWGYASLNKRDILLLNFAIVRQAVNLKKELILARRRINSSLKIEGRVINASI